MDELQLLIKIARLLNRNLGLQPKIDVKEEDMLILKLNIKRALDLIV